MRIHLDQVRRRPFRWHETREVRAADLGRPELLDLGPITWTGSVVARVSGFRLLAHFDYEQTLACMRCLRPLVEPMHSDVECFVLVESPEIVGGEHELRQEDLGVIFVDEETLDLEPLLFEQLQLNIPMKPLCSPSCRGLCPKCGADLNTETCGCEESATDPRWAVLETLRQPDGES